MHTRLILLWMLVLSVAAFGKELTIDEYAEKCVVERDDFKKVTNIHTEATDGTTGDEDTVIKLLNLFATRHDDGTEIFCIGLRLLRKQELGEAHWKNAYDENGKKFDATGQAQEPEKALKMIKESMIFTVTREYLESVKDKGMKWRVYGAGSVSTDIALRRNLIAGLLKRCNALK